MSAVSVGSSWLLCISFLAVGLNSSVTSAVGCDPIVATAVSVRGRVEVRRVNGTQWQPVSLNEIFCAGDRIRVGDRSRADIALANRAVLRLDQNTTITLGKFQKEQAFPIGLIQGGTKIFNGASRAGGTHRFRPCRCRGNEKLDSDRKHSKGNHHPCWEGPGHQRRENVFTHSCGVGCVGTMTNADITNSRQSTWC